jgi:hypothetical protein
VRQAGISLKQKRYDCDKGAYSKNTDNIKELKIIIKKVSEILE